ncbi:PAS domain S-box protein [Paenibacillus sp. BSR1-1]|uniref:PAS domain S-box protein n=1 Tax=Paenibacillus sp. BSR1-1 TaxID=3020845 RepID=UPI0025B0D8FC|nr:PAS domain S-box protein [Paenibacillus sp. BSR1-1]MDN3016424.1 PAS domain S-box protein [Paenibacillus sp. BSR1-1]
MNSPIEIIKAEKRQLLIEYVNENFSRNETLFFGNNDAILAFDLDGNVVQVNPAFEKLSGYSTEESIQMKLQMFFRIESLDEVFHYFHKATLGEVQNFDCKMTTKDGEILDLNITNIPIGKRDTIVGLYTIAKDVTQIKRKKSEVRKIEEFHRVLTDNVLDMILSTSMLGKIIYVSPSCQNILGYTSGDLIGKHSSVLLHQEDKEKAILDRKEVISSLEIGRNSYRFQKKDGSYLWVESICNPIIDPDTKNILEVVSVIRDITERRQAEEALWSRKKAFRDLVEHSPDAVIIVNNETILFINETGVGLLGASTPEDFISKSILELIHPAEHEIAKRRIASVIKGNTTEFKPFNIIRLDGSSFEGEIKGIPTFFQNQPAQHVIIRDNTEKRKTQALLLNSEKLTIAGQLAAGIAHEVRNPLTAIKGFLQLMENQLEEKTYFDIIQSEINRIEFILSELLVLAKPQDLKFGIENMHSIIEDVKTLIDTQAIINNVQIKIVNECRDLMIHCDKNQLKQVFINFLKNAIEAMPDGGMVTIEIKPHNENNIKILFKDTGAGIPHHILKRIGEPFYTTKENGTGLGIMISKQIIENHNGCVHFWSDDKGTIIEMIIPIKLDQ